MHLDVLRKWRHSRIIHSHKYSVKVTCGSFNTIKKNNDCFAALLAHKFRYPSKLGRYHFIVWNSSVTNNIIQRLPEKNIVCQPRPCCSRLCTISSNAVKRECDLCRLCYVSLHYPCTPLKFSKINLTLLTVFKLAVILPFMSLPYYKEAFTLACGSRIN